MARNDSQPGKNSPQSNPQAGPPRGEKPAVPLEKMIDDQPQKPDTKAADQLASEAAKAPSPEVEGPDHAYPEGEDSVTDLVENPRRQKS